MSNPIPPGKPRVVLVTQEPMVNWLSPGQLLLTGLRALVAGVVGVFADGRLVQAALHPAPGPTSDLSARDELWIDFVADTGDGWDSTYSVAYNLARPTLSVDGVASDLPRAQLLVLGGDQVYPTPAGGGYRTRFLDPFRAAFPPPWPTVKPPTPGTDLSNWPLMLAIPGNHDWYDGLHEFDRVFCSRQAIGRWQPVQQTSYFAVTLPHRWHLWGADLQLDDGIDEPQYAWFEAQAKSLTAGDRVVLCVPEPRWVDESERLKRMDIMTAIKSGKANALKAIETQSPAFRSIRTLERLINESQATVELVVAGDSHHYAYWQPTSAGAPHRFTCGGGGAYLRGTHDLPDELSFKSATGTQNYQLDETYPSKKQSVCIRNRAAIAVMNPVRHWRFQLFLVAACGLFLWLLQAASHGTPLQPGGWTGGLWQHWAGQPWLSSIQTMPCDVGGLLMRSPGASLLALLLMAGSGAFSAQDAPSSKVWPTLAGWGHAGLHLAMACLLAAGVARWIPCELLAMALFAVGSALLGGTLFGVWLVLGNLRFFKWHGEVVYSAQAIADYKSFLRMHVTKDELTIYPIKIEKVYRSWVVNSAVARLFGKRGRTQALSVHSGDEPYFVPQAKTAGPRCSLIGKAISIK